MLDLGSIKSLNPPALHTGALDSLLVQNISIFLQSCAHAMRAEWINLIKKGQYDMWLGTQGTPRGLQNAGR